MEASLALPPAAVTPLSATRRFNFGRGSELDNFVYGSERPGYSHPRRDQPSTPRGPNVSDDRVQEWIDYMMANDVRHVLCLLTREELRFYATPLLTIYKGHFDSVTHVDFTTPEWQLQTLLGSLMHAVSLKQRIVVHCSTGQSRTAHVLALWVHRSSNVGLDEAIASVISCAQSTNTMRKPTMDGVMRLLMNTGAMPSSARISSRPPSAKPTPSLSSSADLALFSINADKRIHAQLDPLAGQLKCEAIHISTDNDLLEDTIAKTKARLIVVAVPDEAIQKVVLHLKTRNDVTKVIVCTPVDRDVDFQVGCAVGAARFLPPGSVHACDRNGRFHQWNQDLTNGLERLSLNK
ncbi:hypothetical protein Ae201684P_008745 [Aphanomyces euteiches]|nr:hypothetical protein Ae201684P_008745 [Aphanomyces euteiches]KAH9138177.1 hypothetical protein AeRB84_017456 [Aphanomyces euteiches]